MSNFTTPIVLIAGKDAPRLGGDYFGPYSMDTHSVQINVLDSREVCCLLSQAETIVVHLESITATEPPSSGSDMIPEGIDGNIFELIDSLHLFVHYDYVADEVFDHHTRSSPHLECEDDPLVLIVDWDEDENDYLFRHLLVTTGGRQVTASESVIQTSVSMRRSHSHCDGPVEGAGVETVTGPNANGDCYGTPTELSQAYKDFLRESAKGISFVNHPHTPCDSVLVDTQMLSYFVSRAREEIKYDPPTWHMDSLSGETAALDAAVSSSETVYEHVEPYLGLQKVDEDLQKLKGRSADFIILDDLQSQVQSLEEVLAACEKFFQKIA